MSEPIKGYKVFNPDWTCRNFQYEVGKTFEEDVTPKCCDRGFHFCTKASDCFSYYGFNPENKVAEVHWGRLILNQMIQNVALTKSRLYVRSAGRNS